MPVSAKFAGSLARFKESKRIRVSRCALLMAAAAASWVWQASPAWAQAAPKVRIITSSGDFLIDLRPHVTGPLGPAAEQQPAAFEAPTAHSAPPTAGAASPIPVSAPLFPQEPVISAAPFTETAFTAAQPVQDTPAMTVPAAFVAAVAIDAPPANAASAAEAAEAVQAAVLSWANAWAGKDLNAYFASYGRRFVPAGKQTRNNWEESRRARILGKSRISVKLLDVVIAVQGSLASARFKQNYNAGGLNMSNRKLLELTQEAGERWVIVRETLGH